MTNQITSAAPAAQTFLGMTAHEWSDIFLAIAIIIVLGAVVYFVYQYWKKAKNAVTETETETEKKNAPANANDPANTPVPVEKVVVHKDVYPKNADDDAAPLQRQFYKDNILLAVYDYSRGKLFRMEATGNVDSPYKATEVPSMKIFYKKNLVGKIVVDDGEAEFKPTKEAAEKN